MLNEIERELELQAARAGAPDPELAWRYRRVFDTPEGREVLKDILFDLRFFSLQLSGPEETALHNAAHRILRKCGAWQEHNVLDITASVLRMPLTPPEHPATEY